MYIKSYPYIHIYIYIYILPIAYFLFAYLHLPIVYLQLPMPMPWIRPGPMSLPHVLGPLRPPRPLCGRPRGPRTWGRAWALARPMAWA